MRKPHTETQYKLKEHIFTLVLVSVLLSNILSGLMGERIWLYICKIKANSAGLYCNGTFNIVTLLVMSERSAVQQTNICTSHFFFLSGFLKIVNSL
jgi:hypothetical protein